MRASADTGREGSGLSYQERALELYRLALKVVEAKGRFVSVGLVAYKEYRGQNFGITYLPSTQHLDVWHRRKVLAVNRQQGELRVVSYWPGEWEDELEAEAGQE
jgi:hypothetical protein